MKKILTLAKGIVNSLILLLERNQGEVRFLMYNFAQASTTREYALAVQPNKY
jgi:hypothetical protein